MLVVVGRLRSVGMAIVGVVRSRRMQVIVRRVRDVLIVDLDVRVRRISIDGRSWPVLSRVVRGRCVAHVPLVDHGFVHRSGLGLRHREGRIEVRPIQMVRRRVVVRFVAIDGRLPVHWRRHIPLRTAAVQGGVVAAQRIVVRRSVVDDRVIRGGRGRGDTLATGNLVCVGAHGGRDLCARRWQNVALQRQTLQVQRRIVQRVHGTRLQRLGRLIDTPRDGVQNAALQLLGHICGMGP